MIIIIIIMYIYHARINALSAHKIQINLNTIFYTPGEQSPTKKVNIRYYMEIHTHTHTHTDCSGIWVLIIVGGGNIVRREGFQLGFER